VAGGPGGGPGGSRGGCRRTSWIRPTGCAPAWAPASPWLPARPARPIRAVPSEPSHPSRPIRAVPSEPSHPSRRMARCPRFAARPRPPREAGTETGRSGTLPDPTSGNRHRPPRTVDQNRPHQELAAGATTAVAHRRGPSCSGRAIRAVGSQNVHALRPGPDHPRGVDRIRPIRDAPRPNLLTSPPPAARRGPNPAHPGCSATQPPDIAIAHREPWTKTAPTRGWLPAPRERSRAAGPSYSGGPIGPSHLGHPMANVHASWPSPTHNARRGPNQAHPGRAPTPPPDIATTHHDQWTKNRPHQGSAARRCPIRLAL
jgi:hypothetical protein